MSTMANETVPTDTEYARLGCGGAPAATRTESRSNLIDDCSITTNDATAIASILPSTGPIVAPSPSYIPRMRPPPDGGSCGSVARSSASLKSSGGGSSAAAEGPFSSETSAGGTDTLMSSGAEGAAAPLPDGNVQLVSPVSSLK